ncbi:hypothetical protein IV203_004636 [Nitzschia inconspicua]|uniref:Uncharacterized protein n=1 Tax=Nitzschia inconspicua TaxID=303405 RepID=A0A9K3L454_9STRA|nr:hypothetical protein IV203_004636 [Nitzschia inconspicua]
MERRTTRRNIRTFIPTIRAQQRDDYDNDDNDTSNNNNYHSDELYTIMKRSKFDDDNDVEDDNCIGDNDYTSFLDDLTPPPVNFARNSILFSDNPSTKKRNNIMLDVWKSSRTYLPAVLTGAWPWRDVHRMDQEPVAALYNMIVVRLPVVAVGVVYWKQLLWDHHGLVMDFGLNGGPQDMNPWLVTLILCLILL